MKRIDSKKEKKKNRLIKATLVVWVFFLENFEKLIYNLKIVEDKYLF
jgi:hypothetical protein